MIVFPSAKINLGLNIIGKRADGYHDIETVFYPIRWHDALECVELPASETTKLSVLGNELQIAAEQNLCYKAYNLLKQDFPEIGPINIHLLKSIPSGAGLGGGSADAVAMLKLLDEMFALGLDAESLNQYALRLGSDCPFFLQNSPAIATGRGERLRAISCDLSEFDIHVVYPAVHVNTAAAFADLTPDDFRTAGELESILNLPVAQWRNKLMNAFERSVFNRYPAIAALKEKLYAAGAVYASLSGSGSAVYGLFPKSGIAQLRFDAPFLHKIV